MPPIRTSDLAAMDGAAPVEVTRLLTRRLPVVGANRLRLSRRRPVRAARAGDVELRYCVIEADAPAVR